MSQVLHRPATTVDTVLRRKAEAYAFLDEICQALELSAAQYEAAKTSYEAVADWLSKSTHPVLKVTSLYAHGSTALGTTVRPLTREDFDVDLICLVLGLTFAISPADLKAVVGQRLREHGQYSTMLEEKKRCWRLNYAREFHLDISPTVPNPECKNGGELVPDKSLKSFKPTNPLGYRRRFEERCLLQPSIKHLAVASTDVVAQADIEALPTRRVRRGILRRIVQLLKRHRDIAFADVEADIAPISIIITTLAAKSYEFCVRRFAFDTELDVVVETIRMMPHFIDRPYANGRQIYSIPNETTEGENFADRWNAEPERAKAFYEWHALALADFESIASMEGLDQITNRLSAALGGTVVRKVMDVRSSAISEARSSGRLFVAPTVGLSLTSRTGAVEVPRNTFFGDV